MIYVSVLTSFFGLTEPFFVPEYWEPPSLFNLAQTTGFDIESLIFAFSIGGLATVSYEVIRKTRYLKFSKLDKQHLRHRYHKLIIMSAPLAFILLYTFTGWNIIYVTIASLFIGGVFSLYCRPDLKYKMFLGSIIFFAFYFIFFVALNLFFPNWTMEVWNLGKLTGIMVLKVPLEELLFALVLGFLWSGLYEHLNWYTISTRRR